MVAGTKGIKYKTAPLKSWNKAKELRLAHYKEIQEAPEKGELLVGGSVQAFPALIAGFGTYAHLGGEAYGATVATDPDFALKCAEAVEARGYARDLCSYMRNYWGSMFLDRYSFGGKFPKLNFLLHLHFCDTHGKWYQVVSDYLGIPCKVIEFPTGAWGQREELKLEYLAAQFNDAVEWMEKTLGRKSDDELMIESMKTEFLSQSLWGEIALLNQAIPAPLDHKSLPTLHVLAVLMRHRKECADYYRELLEEVKERVTQKIAAVPTERLRLLHDGQPPWTFLEIFRYLEKFGAVVVGSHYLFYLGGTLWERNDGMLERRKTPQELGIPMRNREEALKVYAQWILYKNMWSRAICLPPQERSDQVIKLVRQWRCDGVVIHLNRGCENMTYGCMENKLALNETGIPTMTYEGNQADARELDTNQIISRVDAFMESFGLSKLEQ